jgi:hypothetical protein
MSALAKPLVAAALSWSCLAAALAFGCNGSLAKSVVPDASAEEAGPREDASPSDDAGIAPPAADATCSVVVAADYDQSCAQDTDCVGVNEIQSCPLPSCVNCTANAINVDAAAAYQAAFMQSGGDQPSAGRCSCPCIGLPVCRAGVCQATHCGAPAADTLPACLDAGGRCTYARGTSCNEGPPDACAYADEICCL